MRRTMLKCKLHRSTVTDADLNYEGSITIDKDLCEKADLAQYEKVDVYNVNNGARFSTYVIHGTKGEICLNGAAARHVHVGDLVIIASYCEVEGHEVLNHKPIALLLDSKNEVKSNCL